MTTPAEQQAANVTPPIPGDIDAQDWILALDATTSAAYVDLSSYPLVFDRYLDVKADGAKIYVAASPVTTAIDETATGSTLTTADGASVCWPVTDGETISIRITDGTPYLHFKGAASGTLRVRTSSTPSMARIGR